MPEAKGLQWISKLGNKKNIGIVSLVFVFICVLWSTLLTRGIFLVLGQ